MSLLKDIVIKGIYYNSIGIRDYTKWSKKMLDYFGPEIKQSMKDIRKWSVAIPASDNNINDLKLNCWEFMGCRSEKVGNIVNADKTDVCPALLEKRLDGIHDGKNAGRACWIVSHTMCNGALQGTCEQKYKTCMLCDFYRYVMEEEENNFIRSKALKEML